MLVADFTCHNNLLYPSYHNSCYGGLLQFFFNEMYIVVLHNALFQTLVDNYNFLTIRIFSSTLQP